MHDSTDCMLTTKDNPFNPYTEWDNWLEFDESHGYYTWNYIARIAAIPEDVGDELKNCFYNRAYDEIIAINNELGNEIYIKIEPDGTRIPTP